MSLLGCSKQCKIVLIDLMFDYNLDKFDVIHWGQKTPK